MNFAALTQSMATLALLSGLAGLLLLAALVVPGSRRALAGRVAGGERSLLALAAGVALAATGGSLYYSEVVGFVPCVLCWYQRIAMYPLVPVLAVGALRADARAWSYGLPLSVVGLGIALYHVLIQFQPALDAGVCAAGVSCTGRYIAVFGFVSIPVMAACGFLLVSALLLLTREASRG